MNYSLKPIGTIRNNVRNPSLSFEGKDLGLSQEELNRQQENNYSQLILDEECIEHLDGLKDFSHILVLTGHTRLVKRVVG